MAAHIALGRPRRADLMAVLRAMRRRDREEVFACRFDNDVDALAEDMLAAQTLAVLGGLVRARCGMPVAVFGAYARTPRTAECALIATDRWPDVAGAMTRWVRREGLPALATAGVTRLEARALETHTDSICWLTRMGARVECRVPGFGRAGQTFVQLALLLDPHDPGGGIPCASRRHARRASPRPDARPVSTTRGARGMPNAAAGSSQGPCVPG